MKTILLFTALLAITQAGCKRCYRCNQPDPLVTVCRSSNDTIWFVSYKGISMTEQRIAEYAAMGYTCNDTIIDIYYAGSALANEKCLNYEDYEMYTWQGYDCYQTK